MLWWWCLSLAHAGEVKAVFSGQVRGQVEATQGEAPELALWIKRLRPGAKASLAGDRARVKAVVELAPGGPEALDFWGDLRLGEEVRLRMGQFKAPFTAYRLRSFTSMVLTGRSFITKAVGGERQLGTQLSAGSAQTRLLIGVFSGVNQRASHNTRLPEMYGLPVENRSALGTGAPKTDRLGPEVFVHVARYQEGLDPTQGRDTSTDGAWHTGAAISMAVDAGAERGELGARVGLDGMVQGHGLGVSAVAFTSAAPTEREWVSAFHGGLLEGNVRILPGWEIGSRVAGTVVSQALRADAAQVGRGFVPEEAPALWGFEAEAGVGLNYVPVPGLKLQTDGAVQRRGTEGQHQDVWISRLQTQVVF